jgi:hypothetical protein
MVQVITFASNSRSAADAARDAAQQAQTWLEREHVHPSELAHISTATSSCIGDSGFILYSYTLTLVLHRLLPVGVLTWEEGRYAA